MTHPCSFALVALAVFGLHCGGADPSSDPNAASSDNLSAGSINGGTTGAMVRQTTAAGYSCIEGSWTLPDYDPAQPGEPWIYYGFGDEQSLDMEVGLAFQKGDGTAAKPHRWLPYMRKGHNFYFAGEGDRVLPGDTVDLKARFDGNSIKLLKDGQTVSLSGGGTTIQSLDMSGLSPSATHIRRVVGNAISGTYSGGTLGTVGPVSFQNSYVCKAGGGTAPFEQVATWHETRGGVLYGSVKFPSSKVQDSQSGSTDTVTLFPMAKSCPTKH